MRISDWSSDVCSSDLRLRTLPRKNKCYFHSVFKKNMGIVIRKFPADLAGIGSDSDQHRTPGESAADALHQHLMARLDAAIAKCHVKRQGNTGRRGICMLVAREDRKRVVAGQKC